MAEPLVDGLDPRKKLYSALVGGSDKELANQVKQFSYNKFNGLLDNNDFVRDLFMDISERGIVLDPKNPNASKDPVEFANAFIYREPVAKPQPQVQAAPAMQVAAPMEEEETYTPPPDPLIGSSKYNNIVRELNPFPTPTLGETFGGAPAVFETREQRRQEEMSPVFKAHNLAFVDNPFSDNPYNAPVAEEQRKAQRQFAKATKQEKEAALRGGTGFELQQKQANEKRETTKFLKDFGSSIGATFDNMINKVKAAEAMFGAKQRSLLTFGEKGKKAEEQEKKIKQQVLGYLDQVDQDFAAKQAEYNIEGNIFDVISKGQLDRLPEAFAYNLAQIGINALGAGTTGGYSTFAQVVPDMYKAGVEEIARKTNTTPEEVIASGKDKEIITYTAGVVSGGIDYYSSGLLGKAMKSKGAYKYLRDLALDKIGKTKWKQAAASAAALGGVANIEGLTEGAQGLIEVAAPQIASAESFKEARENIYGELQKPSTQRRLASDIVGGAAGGGGLVALGRGAERVLQGDFTYGDVRKSPASQRADMDIVQTDNKIQERNKIAQAMEEAVKGNPEAEGQIREQYQKRVNEAAPTDDEVLAAYEGLALLPETEEKNTIRENLEAYMAEKGIQPEAAGMDAGLGEGMRVTAPSEETMPPAPPVEPVAPEVTPESIAPAEEVVQEDEDLASLGQAISGLEQTPTTGMFEGIEGPTQEAAPVAPVEEVVPEVTPEVVPEVVPAPKGKKKAAPVTPAAPNVEEPLVVQKTKREDFPDYQPTTRTPITQKLLDFFAEVNSIPKFTEDLNKGTYIKWLQNENNLGAEVATLLNAPKKAFDAIVKYQADKMAFEKSKPTPVTPPAPKVEKPKPKKEETPKPQAKAESKPTKDRIFNEEEFVRDIDRLEKEKAEGSKNIGLYSFKDKFVKVVKSARKMSKKALAELRDRVSGMDNVFSAQEIIDLPNGSQAIVMDKATGKIGNELTEDEINNIPQKHWNKFEQTIRELSKRGIQTDLTKRSNVLYDNNKGFQFIDLEGASIEGDATNKFFKKDGKEYYYSFEKYPFFPKEYKSAKEIFTSIKSAEAKAAPVKPTPAAPKKEEAPKPQPKKEEPKKEKPKEKKYPIEDKGKWYADEDYEKRGGELITMTPDEFLAQSKPLEIDEEARDNINTLKEQIQNGGKLDPLAIYSADKTKSLSTDGRHRAIAAKELGIKEVPVLNFVKAEAKPTTGTPQEGDAVEIAPQREGGSPRKMVFKDGEWKQNVGGDIVKVGPSVQGQAQEMFAGKTETKAEPAETTAQAEFTSKQESSASTEFDSTKKPSKIKTKSFDGKHGKGAFERMKNITDNFEDIMDGLSGKIKQDCL